MRERHSVEVTSVEFAGAAQSRPAPGVLEGIASADVIVFAPSNPVTSIGPMLAVPGIREALRRAGAPVVAVSPIIGDAAVSGPAAALMRMQGWPSTIAGIATAYEDFLDVLVVDSADAHAAEALSSEKLRVVCTNTLMRSVDDKVNLARVVLESALRLRHKMEACLSRARRESRTPAQIPRSQEKLVRDDN